MASFLGLVVLSRGNRRLTAMRSRQSCRFRRCKSQNLSIRREPPGAGAGVASATLCDLGAGYSLICGLAQDCCATEQDCCYLAY